MYKLNDWLKNLKFRSKILLICLISGILPMVALGSFSYSQIKQLLTDREKEVLAETLNQATQNMDYKLDSYKDAINQITWNENIKRGVTATYDSNYEMYLFYRDTLNPIISNTNLLYREIKRITIFTDNHMYAHGKNLRPLWEIEEKDWYESALETSTPKIIVSATDQSFEVINRIFDNAYGSKNFVYMDINYGHFFSALADLFESNYGIIILDHYDHPVYSFQHFADSDISYALSADQLLARLDLDTLKKEYVYDIAALPLYNWNIYLYRPLETIYASTYKITATVLAVILICILILILSIYFLSRVTVRPLEKLAKNMEKVEQGDLSVTVNSSATDEIGGLIRQFSNMVDKLKEMIDTVYKSKISQQQYEFKALQAQINPHFLYNSLSLINNKAIISEQEDISQMAQLLSTFYRTTLNKGKNIISVKEEIENTTSYINIQRMMHSNSFDVIYELEPNIFEFNMLNLILQPLVENAINHGIDHKITPGKGRLIVSGKRDDDQLIFTVTDNGCGIDPETLETILSTQTKGYGVQNVHHRVQLYYGQEYGLNYESNLNIGTRVTLSIPVSKL